MRGTLITTGDFSIDLVAGLGRPRVPFFVGGLGMGGLRLIAGLLEGGLVGLEGGGEGIGGLDGGLGVVRLEKEGISGLGGGRDGVCWRFGCSVGFGVLGRTFGRIFGVVFDFETGLVGGSRELMCFLELCVG